MADAALIKKIYQEQLGRDPDPAGLKYWAESGLSEADLRSNIGGTPEGQAKAGTSVSVNVASPTPTNTSNYPDRNSLINAIYYQELGQLRPDKAGLDYWNKSGLDEAGLRANIRAAGGLKGKSAVQDLLADQSYGAFLRKMQFDESAIESSREAAKTAAKNRIKLQAGQFNQQLEQGVRSANQNYEARGMYRSGGRLDAVNKQHTNVDSQRNQFNFGVNEAAANYDRDAATRIGDMRRENAEQQSQAADRLTRRSAGM